MSEGSLLNTSTWAIASTCALFIIVSLLVERFIFYISRVLKKHKQEALHEALDKIKEELMVVGFISLALTVGQEGIARICVPEEWVKIMHMCKSGEDAQKEPSKKDRSSLIAANTGQNCSQGKVLFMSWEGVHQLHILVFILVVIHVISSVIIMALGLWKVNHWKSWEKRATMKESVSHHDVRYTKDTTFVRNRGVGVWYTNPILGYVAAFFGQFFHSVTESDYQTLRHGFIKIHMPANLGFDFHKYILRSLEDDFKHVVGVSPTLWAYVVFLTLINFDGWEGKIWFSFLPVVMVLVIGTKLQRIITRMAVRIMNKHAITEGLPGVVPCDEHFWFRCPRFVLHCVHIVLFQNSMELSYHIWVAVTFPTGNCLTERGIRLVLRLLLGMLAQIVCGYITLPIYALVVQMGSQMKCCVFNEHIQQALVTWHHNAQRHLREGGHYRRTSTAEDYEQGLHLDQHEENHTGQSDLQNHEQNGT